MARAPAKLLGTLVLQDPLGEFIIGLIESACPSLLLPNPDPLLCKTIVAFSDIDVRLESIIYEEGPPLWEVANHLQRTWRNRGVELDKNRIN